MKSKVYRLGRANVEGRILSTNKRFLAIIERSRSRVKKEAGISATEIRRRLKLD